MHKFSKCKACRHEDCRGHESGSISDQECSTRHCFGAFAACKALDGMRRAVSLMFRNSLDVSKMWDLWKEISSGCVLKRWTPGSAASACAARPQRNARIDSGDRIMVLSLDAVIRTPTEL